MFIMARTLLRTTAFFQELQMKICPVCRKTYSDDGLNFCLDDGSVLTIPASDAPPTMVMHKSAGDESKSWCSQCADDAAKLGATG
jgi:hypothetical protein